MAAIRILVAGAAGRMGRAVMRETLNDVGLLLAGGFEREGHEAAGADLGALAGVDLIGITLSLGAPSSLDGADVIIDFTSPEASVLNARRAAAAGVAHIIGSTGFSKDQELEILRLSEKTVIVKSGNMSLAVNLLAYLVREAAARLGAEYDIEIAEAHHRSKKDAPSGTALMLGAAAAAGRGVRFEDVAVMSREGMIGARAEGAIGFSVIRGGGIVGDHDVAFAGADEILTLSHRALDRSLFARGALVAAKWAAAQKPGLYSMADVLSLPKA